MTGMGLTFRRLKNAPGFTFLSIITLGLGIGTTTAMFSVVNGILLQPLPFEEAGDLVYIGSYFTPESGRDIPDFPIGSPEYFDYQNQTRSMEAVAAVSTEAVSITAGEGRPESVRGGWVSPSMFAVLKTPPLLGRTLVQEDGGAEPSPVVVLSHDLWQRRFGGDSTVIGNLMELNAPGASPDPISAEIVGVMPAGFSYPGEGIQLWAPLLLDPARTWRQGHWFRMIGRLAPEVTLREAEEEMEILMERWAVTYPDHHAGHGLYLESLLDREVGEVESTLFLLLAAVGLVLLIACANVANLLLVRGETRRTELAVRSALGASGGRLFREVLAESVTLAGFGGALGLLLAWVGVTTLLALEPGNLPRVDEVAMDGRVLAFTGCAVLLTTVLFGVIPALRGAAPKPGDSLQDSSTWTTVAKHRLRTRRGVVVAEVALSVLLIVGAGLMIRSLRNLLDEDPGFRTENLLFAQLNLPSGEYTRADATLFYQQLEERVRTLPGVLGVARISRPPLLWENENGRIHIVGEPDEPCCAGSAVSVGDGLLDLMEVEVLEGRAFEPGDFVEGAEPVCLIDEAMARRYFPAGPALGRSVSVTMGQDWRIVGVVGDITFNGPGRLFPTVYLPATRAPAHFARSGYLVVRTMGDPGALVDPIQQVTAEVDPRQAVLQTYTMEQILNRALARPRFVMTLLSVFAVVALFLGAIGIFGVISYGVALRAGEMGVRRALGAEDREVVTMVMMQGITLAVIGLVLGLVCAHIGGRVLAGLLHEVSPTDPVTYAWAAFGTLIVASLASYLPARSSVSQGPLDALKTK